MNNLIQEISPLLPTQFDLKVKRAGIYQLFAPFYHEDGDMYDVFLKPTDNGLIEITDFGLTMMRVSYVYDFDTPNKEKILSKIVQSNGVKLIRGNLVLVTEKAYTLQAILQFTQTVAKITNARLFQREIVQSLFFEQLEEHVYSRLLKYHPQKDFTPISGHDEYAVNYVFNHRKRPLYLFGINNQSNAKLTTISCLKFLQEGFKFRSVIVFEDLDVISKNDIARVMSVADKEFPSLNDFIENSETFFERESQN